MSRPLNRQPQSAAMVTFESIEPRVLFSHTTAADFTSINTKGTVRLIGTESNDRFVLTLVNGNYVIEHDGRTAEYFPGRVDRFVFEGGAGNDYADLSVSGNQTTLIGGDGNDTLIGGTYRDFLFGNVGADLLKGSGHEDRIEGGSGADRIFGNAGNDTLFGGRGDDRINAGPGNDHIDAGKGNDAITTAGGNDTVFGGAGIDLGLDLSTLLGPVDGVETVL